MADRKGLGRGTGKGYKNIVGKDPRVHSDSARGRKQPQKIPFQPSPMKDQELAKAIRNLDPIEERFFHQFLANGQTPEKALEVVVNMVEGDTSQLSPGLLKYAEKKGWLKGFDVDTDGDGVPDSKDCQPLNPKMQDFSAETVLKQLGGGRFIAMTGAKNFLKGKNFIQFDIPKAKDGINRVTIRLTSMDLYDMEFGMMRTIKGIPTYFPKGKMKGLYDDMLQESFTSRTGLNTSL